MGCSWTLWLEHSFIGYFRWPSFNKKHVNADRNGNDQAFRRSKTSKGQLLLLTTVLLREYPAPHPPRRMVDRC
eukprot:6201888-Pleurochrysis_carterae.AAC.2